MQRSMDGEIGQSAHVLRTKLHALHPEKMVGQVDFRNLFLVGGGARNPELCLASCWSHVSPNHSFVLEGLSRGTEK